jgi:hypothetical protein
VTTGRFTRPPVPGCLVTVKEPSARASTMGNPTRSMAGIVHQSTSAFPPEACAPHSLMCPATTPCARRSQSSGAQPNVCIMGP